LILNGFADEAGWLQWCRYSEHPITVRRARPSELFYKKHLYSTVSEFWIKDPTMERHLSVLAGEAQVTVQVTVTVH